MIDFKLDIHKILKKHVKVDIDLIEVPPDPGFGDYALPCFSLTKELKKSPDQIAEDLCKKLSDEKLFKEISTKGPYLNFFIKDEIISKNTLLQIYKDKKYASSADKKTIMVEYSSPNTNKPLHLGHLRNITLGKSLSNILKFRGNKIVQSCLVNDRGIHITKSMLAYQKWGKGEPDKKSDHFVGDFYVLFNQKSKENPELEKDSHDMLKKWESRDKETLVLWKKMNRWALDGFNETYKKLGIKFDKLYYESDMYDKGKNIVMRGLKDGVFEKDDGAVVARLEKFKMPDKVLVRADGTTIYMTQDIFLGIKKFEDYRLDKSIYVVGSEQNLHFQQLFKILDILGNKKVKDCYHLGYGMVYLPEGRMKSREGNVVDADNIIDDMMSLAGKEIKKRHKKLSAVDIKKRAELIGLGALKFFLLKTDPLKDMTFNPEESISFEGETGPYVQYAYARIASILRKHKKSISDKVDFSKVGDDEIPLVKMLYKYPEIVRQASQYKPSTICRYLLDLSQEFNEYYHRVPILKADEDLMKSRLLLVYCIKEVIKSGLKLLDIDVLEEM